MIDLLWHHGHCDVCGTRCVMVAQFGYNKQVQLQKDKYPNDLVGLLEEAKKRPPRPYKICVRCLIETLVASQYCPTELEVPLGELLSRAHLAFRDRNEDGTVIWAIKDGPLCLNRDMGWEYESQPSSRTEDFLARTRFTLNEALDLIEKLKRKGT